MLDQRIDFCVAVDLIVVVVEPLFRAHKSVRGAGGVTTRTASRGIPARPYSRVKSERVPV